MNKSISPKIFIFLGLSALIMLLGCTTSVNLKIKRAPELNLVGIKKLKLSNFVMSGNLDLDLMKKKKGLMGALVDVGVGLGSNKLAEGKYPALVADQTQGIKSELLKNGYYQVTDGEEYDALITGTAYYEVKDAGADKESKDKNGNITKWYEITRTATVQVNFSVANKAGDVIGTSQVKGVSAKTNKADTHEDARNNHAPWERLVREAIANSNGPLVKKIAPYFVFEKRTFAKGKHPGFKSGNKAAKAGNWASASESWKLAQSSSSTKDQAAAIYNLAIYDEVEGKLEDALAKFEQASTLAGGKYTGDVARTRARIAEAKQLQAAE